MTHLTPDEDRELCRLVADTQLSPADERFVAGVTRRIVGRRRLGRAATASAGLVAAAALVLAAPVLLSGAAYVAMLPAEFAGLFGSPAGLALSMAAGALAAARAFAAR